MSDKDGWIKLSAKTTWDQEQPEQPPTLKLRVELTQYTSRSQMADTMRRLANCLDEGLTHPLIYRLKMQLIAVSGMTRRTSFGFTGKTMRRAIAMPKHQLSKQEKQWYCSVCYQGWKGKPRAEVLKFSDMPRSQPIFILSLSYRKQIFNCSRELELIGFMERSTGSFAASGGDRD
ncbi:hypothetical protein NDI45_08050 [Leptolyngbya sp. GB1-A1]|uniref:hypothetical protein n=1 Tax=Leptolyngbya sp. GB1-A1 TaxID=2933908 RepID=UPI003297B9B9